MINEGSGDRRDSFPVATESDVPYTRLDVSLLPTSIRNSLDDSDQVPVVEESVAFDALYTHWLAGVEVLLLVGQFVFALAGVSSLFENNAVQIAITIQVGVSLTALVFDRILHHCHRKRRAKGFLAFYRKTRSVRQIPVATIFIVNTVCLLLWALYGLVDFPKSWSELLCYQILSGVQAVVSIPALIAYIVTVWKHNRSQPVSDAHQVLYSGLRKEYQVAETSAVTQSASQDDLIDEQAELIQCLQEQHKTLSLEILNLQSQLQGRTSNASGLDDAEARHLIMSKEQEVRVLESKSTELIQKLAQARMDIENRDKTVSNLQEHNAELGKDLESLWQQLDAASKKILKLELMLEVEKEANIEAQMIIHKSKPQNVPGGSNTQNSGAYGGESSSVTDDYYGSSI
eukprot:GFYU01002140.1.p1 GENE.GFYU01002140.1~~GFYU01002140.1.p1  ORF type:complete len:402 (+),score=53.73 GFYU01002140.1:87-1292(+)